jgi:hypothetical protein
MGRRRPEARPGRGTGLADLGQIPQPAKIRDHLRGKDLYGCWGDQSTHWFALDVDYHGGDIGLFLEVLRILDELAAFFPQLRWVYALSRNGVSGLHLIGLLPCPRLLEEVRCDVGKVLAYLEDKHTATLLSYKPERIKEQDWQPVAGLEIYPATNHNFRLPYAADRITITDEWLNRPGEVNLKPNLIKFMAYVRDPSRQAVPLAEVIDYLQAHVEWKAPKRSKNSGGRCSPPRASTATRSADCCGRSSCGRTSGLPPSSACCCTPAAGARI